MRVVVVSNSDVYMERIELLKAYYEKRGYEVVIMTSDFKHIHKSYIKEKNDKYIYISTMAYYKNLSVKRILSHMKFAKDAFKKIETLAPDMLHVLIPANSLAREADYYKKKNPSVRLYFDIIDLWPETMPIGKLKDVFPFTIWKKFRDNHLENADVVYTECDLFQERLGVIDNPLFQTLYWAKSTEPVESNPRLSDDEMHVCYLGSINNIIDIDEICRICSEINEWKRCIVHIIGKGEKKEEFIQRLEEEQLQVIDHGVIYDSKEKQKVFDICQFGLNIMKPSVCVGLTMKSLDYFQAGLPIINNIACDTWRMVETCGIGVNRDAYMLEKITNLGIKELLEMRKHVIELYNSKFTQEAFEHCLDNVNKQKECSK